MAEPDPGELLRRHGLRSTPQRRAILSAFHETPDEHLSAEVVLSRAARQVPDIGRGTVYATLAELSELGMLASVGNPEPVRYERNLRPHDHFQCQLCLRLFDVDLGGAELRERPLRGYEIETIAVRAEGTCAECRDFRQGAIDGAAQVIQTPSIEIAALGSLACACVESPLGELGLAASADGIAHVAYASHAGFDAIGERARSRRGPAPAKARLRALAGSIDEYFAGAHAAIPDVIDWGQTPQHHRDTMLAVQAIGYDEMRSYELLGEFVDAYECGRLLGSNPVPLLIPCHRVSRGAQPAEWYVGGDAALHYLRAMESGAAATAG